MRDNMPGLTSNILVLDTWPTVQAYNNWGGKYLYGSNSTDKTPATTVSMNRPLNGNKGTLDREVEFVKWADAVRIPIALLCGIGGVGWVCRKSEQRV